MKNTSTYIHRNRLVFILSGALIGWVSVGLWRNSGSLVESDASVIAFYLIVLVNIFLDRSAVEVED